MRGAFWFCVFDGALNAELFVDLLRQMMQGRRKLVHLVLDSLPGTRKPASGNMCVHWRQAQVHFLPGYAPDLNPDELVWSHVKRTGTARRRCEPARSLMIRSTHSWTRLSEIQSSSAHFSELHLSPIFPTAE